MTLTEPETSNTEPLYMH